MTKIRASDVIVIGSGMGGLTAAACLARKGLKVQLFEKEGQVGGYVVSFNRDDLIFDATGAFIGGCHEGGEFYQILRELGALEDVEFIPVQDVQNIYPGFEVHFEHGGFDAYLDALLSLFPEEENGLKGYLSLVDRIGKEIQSYSGAGLLKKGLFPFHFPSLVRFHRSSHQVILDRFFKGREIKMALHTFPATEPPSRLSFLFVAILIGKILREGVFYPRGGMGKLSQAIAKAFLRSGGEIHLHSEVDQILVKDGRAEGVITKDGRICQATRVISDVNPNLLGRMLPIEFRKSFLKKKGSQEYSLSCFILYLATDLDLKGMGLPYFTYLRFLSDLEEEHRMLRSGRLPKNPTMMVSVPTLLDLSLAPPRRHIVKVLVTVPYHYKERWGRGDTASYSRIKEEFSRRVIRQLESRLIPGLSNRILFYEAATPLTLERYTGNELGAMYGLACTPQQFGSHRPGHSTSIGGLFQVGHYTRPSHGIVGASLSGLFVSQAILSKRSHEGLKRRRFG